MHPTRRSRNTLGKRRRAGHKLGEPPQVLRDRRQCELELRAAWASQTQFAEPQNALEMRKQHLDLLAIAARLRKRLRLGEGMDDVPTQVLAIVDKVIE
jgi:hypothetical protein